MSQPVRRKNKKEDARPISDEEQERVIRQLRAKNEKDKKFARQCLDILVLMAMLMGARNCWRYVETAPTLLTSLVLAQTILLPLSLSPGWTKIPQITAIAERAHRIIVIAQLILFMAIFLTFRQDPRISPDLLDMLRWALPELVAGGVEMQRGSERESEQKLQNLEGLKYNLKGA